MMKLITSEQLKELDTWRAVCPECTSEINKNFCKECGVFFEQCHTLSCSHSDLSHKRHPTY